MDVTSTTQSAASATTSQATQNEVAAEAMITSDFETFLKMLTAQMENQDPMNPIESTDYAVQLATFSSVEQQVQTNDLLKGLATQLGIMGMADMAGWVGMEARVSAPALFDGSPITLMPEPPAAADTAYLVVKDASGAEVQRNSVPTNSDPIEWAGVDSQGNPLPNGTYTFTLESFGNGNHLTTETIDTYARVTETQNEGGRLLLVLESGAKVEADDISALREPG